MFPIILALCFTLKIIRCSKHYDPIVTKTFCYLRANVNIKIFCLRSLQVPLHDIGRSFLWRHEKVHPDNESSFFGIIKVSQLK